MSEESFLKCKRIPYARIWLMKFCAKLLSSWVKKAHVINKTKGIKIKQ